MKPTRIRLSSRAVLLDFAQTLGVAFAAGLAFSVAAAGVVVLFASGVF